MAGKKRFREDTAGSDPFIAINTDKKKAKPAPLTEDEDTPEEEELDLTEGTRRGAEDPVLGPEKSKDVKDSEIRKEQQMGFKTAEVTKAPLGGGKE